MVDDEETGQLKELEKLIKVNKIAAQQPFATAVAPVYEAAKKKYGAAIIEKIQAIK
jgi:TRAP-type C4-dicarboxylate transport system substrate-binding protein